MVHIKSDSPFTDMVRKEMYPTLLEVHTQYDRGVKFLMVLNDWLLSYRPVNGSVDTAV